MSDWMARQEDANAATRSNRAEPFAD